MLMKRFYSDVFGRYKSEEWEVFKRMQKSPEAQEAFQAFLERRKPDFSKFSQNCALAARIEDKIMAHKHRESELAIGGLNTAIV